MADNYPETSDFETMNKLVTPGFPQQETRVFI